MVPLSPSSICACERDPTRSDRPAHGRDERAERETLEHRIAARGVEASTPPHGTVVVTLKTPWRDGTTHPPFEPPTLLERLASLTPRPRINLLHYHAILAPHAAGRAAAVASGRPSARDQAHNHPSGAGAAPAPIPLLAHAAAVPEVDAESTSAVPGGPTAPRLGPGARNSTPADPPPRDPAPAALHPARWRWADLLQRVFSV